MLFRNKFLLFFLGVAGSSHLFASPAEEPKQESVAELVNSNALLDQTQDAVATKINLLANQMDSFFATERADDELGRSRLRIRYSYFTRERELGRDVVDYRINLKLPKLQEKFKFEYFSKPTKKKEPIAQAQSEAEERIKRSQVKQGWTFNADIGVNVSIPPRLVTRARARRNFDAGSFIHRFAEEVIYVTDERGLVEDTLLQSDLRLNQTQLFRFINRASWRVLKKTFIVTQGPTVLHTFTENDAISYNLIMTSFLDNGVYYVNAYTASINYRRNLYKNWVYLDLIPGLDFPKNWSFRRTPFAIFQFEVLFGG